jgi:hypothetical protein
MEALTRFLRSNILFDYLYYAKKWQARTGI